MKEFLPVQQMNRKGRKVRQGRKNFANLVVE
jgi:hypothetical protein